MTGPAVQTKTCPKCKGAGHRVDRDQVKNLCSRCDGSGEVCQCHAVALFRCPTHNDQHNERTP